MTGISVPNLNQLSTRAMVRGQDHDRLPFEENIQTAYDRNGDNVGDKWHPRGNESKPFSIFQVAGLMARGVRL